MRSEQLEYFVSVYREQSFARAARKIPITPQGVIKAVRALEKEFAVPLFTSGKGQTLRPTPYADELFELATLFHDKLEALETSFAHMRSRERREIRMGLASGIPGFLGSDFLTGFKTQHPEITVVADEVPDVACDEGLLQEKYDLALTILPTKGALDTLPLYSCAIGVWVHARSRLARKEAVEIADLARHRLATPGKGFKSYDAITAQCLDRDIVPRELITTTEMFWIYEFVRCNRGMGTNTEHLLSVPAFCADAEVLSLPFEDLRWSIGLSKRTSRNLDYAETALYNYCVAFFEGEKKTARGYSF
ncbi:MAG: LysR family transcriptional regulator [Coriobacteriales bacterium]|nr:LysR family transcriptional regulator [Coriobacteriales bacterium]